MIGRLFGFIFKLLFLGFIAGVLFATWTVQQTRAPGPLVAPTTVIIEAGTGTIAMGKLLEKNNVVTHDYLFLMALALSGNIGNLQAGEYEFPAHVSPMGAITQITDGQVLQHKITIPEGLSTAEIIALLNADTVLTGTVTSLPAEGSLLPETYAYIRGTTRADIVKRMQAAMTKLITPLWTARHPDFPLKTMNDAVTLASIVEKETGQADERPHVASVFFNRLQLGMKLQSDPTVIYAITKGAGPLGRPLYTKDLEETKSPYNTYMFAGLPPGPIANPGAASLRAVFAPLRTNDLYFVADGTGGHAFAETLEGHNKNVAAWRASQKAAE